MRTVYDRLLDVLLVLAAAAVHVWAAVRADALPPGGVFEALVAFGPLAAYAVAVVLLLVRGQRAGLQAACVLAWLLALFALPSGSNGLRFVLAAVVLSVAVGRPRFSSDRADAG